MNNYRMIIQYDGTRYKGWQRQKSSADSIQGRIEMILSKMVNCKVEIDGAGRTDAGVHARGQVANVHLKEAYDAVWLQKQMNAYLPEDIRILEVREAGERFHSRLNATGKVYEYRILKKDCQDVFRRKYVWQLDKELNVEKMRQAAELLKGQHDFKGFCTKASKKKSTIRTIYEIEIEEGEQDVLIRYTGNGFLYNMVRILTGTLIEIGVGEREPDSIQKILTTGDRKIAGQTAPAQGLFLAKVLYD